MSHTMHIPQGNALYIHIIYLYEAYMHIHHTGRDTGGKMQTYLLRICALDILNARSKKGGGDGRLSLLFVVSHK